MGLSVGSKRARLGGIFLLLLAGVLAFSLLLATPFTGCTDVGVPADADTGYEFVGVENGNVVYSPDGANVCETPLGVVAIPLVSGAGGLTLLAFGRDRREPTGT